MIVLRNLLISHLISLMIFFISLAYLMIGTKDTIDFYSYVSYFISNILPYVVVWSLLATGIERKLEDKGKKFSFYVYLSMGMGFSLIRYYYAHALNEPKLDDFNLFVLFTFISYWWLQQRIKKHISNKDLKLYMIKLLIAIPIGLVTFGLPFYLYLPNENAIIFIPMVSLIPMILFAPFAWIIDWRLQKKTRYQQIWLLLLHIIISCIYIIVHYLYEKINPVQTDEPFLLWTFNIPSYLATGVIFWILTLLIGRISFTHR
ncbi:hypothetical protein SAMN05444392_11199 [Seinonella peptonophila]|uniref:Uncharacterized protein n=1 Tax=Seinonella peptonophila TaxID=112248 RepID=A0A1M5A1R4_9BACL|nr:hypothetical protein [Seinonella peptonophila]SHF24161.1 hypothetical protein SAMN05444392_11199 [Seinonella peptonophila]